MKKPLLWCALFSLVVIVQAKTHKPAGPAPTPQPPAAKGPKIRFINPKYDFGDRLEGPDIKHVYRFKNVGTEPLVLGDPNCTCGCTGAILSAREIPPGGEGAIETTYHSQGRPGKAVKSCGFPTNDLTAPNPRVEFTINVIREIDITPERAYFYGVRKGQSRAISMEILAQKGKMLKISSAEARNKKVAVALTPLEKDGRKGGSLVVTLPADAPLGDANDEVVLKTTDPKRPEIVIPVQGEVLGRVQYIPKSLNLGNGQPLTLNLTIDPPQGFAFRSVSTEKRLVKPWILKTRQNDGRDFYQLVVNPPHGRSIPAGAYGDVIHLYTNDDAESDVAIPVSGVKN